MLSPGVILQQRYRIKRLLARCGMGAVYEAEAVHLRNATVAVKETFFSEDRKTLREQFEREAWSESPEAKRGRQGRTSPLRSRRKILALWAYP